MNGPLPAAILPVGAESGRQVRRLALIFGFSALSRLLLITLLPLKAAEIFGLPGKVSAIYFLAGCAAIATSLLIPALVRRSSRRSVFMLGVACLGLCLPFLASRSPVAFALGLGLQCMGTVIIEVAVALYALDSLKRNEFLRLEPLRLFFGGISAVVGPWLGVYLATTYAPSISFMLSGAVVVGLAAYFLAVRRNLGEAPKISRRPAHPLRHIAEFMAQPRMRLAYLLAIGRTGWWTTFYIYLPIFALSLGFSELAAATVVSLTMLWLLTTPLWGRVARRVGTRTIVCAGNAVCGLATIGAAVTQAQPALALALFVLAALGLGILDGPGNTYFLRAVRPLRRAEMTSVFSTYRDIGQAVPQLVYAILLLFFDLESVLYAAGAGTLALAWLSLYLPRRL